MWPPSTLRIWLATGGLLGAEARRFIEADMVTSLAGLVGQRLFEPASGHPRSWGDDQNHAWELATLVHDTEWVVEVALHFATVTARRLLRRKAPWRAVERVADALLAQTTLGEECLDVLVFDDGGIYDMVSRSREEMGQYLARIRVRPSHASNRNEHARKGSGVANQEERTG
jgi:hypothetical protein